MEDNKLWNKELEETTKKEARSSVLKAFGAAEKRKKPSIDEMFEDVYDEMPWNLKEQREQMWGVVKRWKDKGYYDTDNFKESKNSS